MANRTLAFAADGQRPISDENLHRFLEVAVTQRARTLLGRAVFWLWFCGSCGSVLGGLVAIYELFGMAALWVAVAGVYLFCMWVIARTGSGGGEDPEMYTWMGGTPPGKPQLPSSGTPQIGRASTALTPSRPGPVARR